MLPRGPARSEDLDDLDQAAARALDVVDDTAARQLDALDALDALAHACERRVEASALAGAVRALRRERARFFGVRHRERVERARDRYALSGARAQDALVRALEECLAFLRATEGSSGEVRTLELMLEDARRGDAGPPRPFFARFLEDGRQRR